ncbi:mitochondrial ribosomal protein S34 [Leptinotarsa decemlineata]|uniref:mitochondrial ribosomal protein S34 n=1 Tax=Leptinotarsa decemlineata TaxID=7539 RepID=UPI003D308F06
MPYKYIGRTTDFKGKTLWEILGNLKNFGVGRIIARNMFERYPEPSYIKILKVETLPNPEKPSHDDIRKVRVWVEKTFRGVTEPKTVCLESVSYKTDYKLIPKDAEVEYCKKTAEKPLKIFPKYIDFPPLMKELLIREAKSPEDKTLAEQVKLEVLYNRISRIKSYKIAQEGEEPNVELVTGLGTPVSPRLYEGVKL